MTDSQQDRHEQIRPGLLHDRVPTRRDPVTAFRAEAKFYGEPDADRRAMIETTRSAGNFWEMEADRLVTALVEAASLKPDVDFKVVSAWVNEAARSDDFSFAEARSLLETNPAFEHANKVLSDLDLGEMTTRRSIVIASERLVSDLTVSINTPGIQQGDGGISI